MKSKEILVKEIRKQDTVEIELTKWLHERDVNIISINYSVDSVSSPSKNMYGDPVSIIETYRSVLILYTKN